jgi:hypothetical protein
VERNTSVDYIRQLCRSVKTRGSFEVKSNGISCERSVCENKSSILKLSELHSEDCGLIVSDCELIVSDGTELNESNPSNKSSVLILIPSSLQSDTMSPQSSECSSDNFNIEDLFAQTDLSKDIPFDFTLI